MYVLRDSWTTLYILKNLQLSNVKNYIRLKLDVHLFKMDPHQYYWGKGGITITRSPWFVVDSTQVSFHRVLWDLLYKFRSKTNLKKQHAIKQLTTFSPWVIVVGGPTQIGGCLSMGQGLELGPHKYHQGIRRPVKIWSSFACGQFIWRKLLHTNLGPLMQILGFNHLRKENYNLWYNWLWFYLGYYCWWAPNWKRWVSRQ